MSGAISLELNEVGSNWSLISYLIAVPENEEKIQVFKQNTSFFLVVNMKVEDILLNCLLFKKEDAKKNIT